MYMGLNLMKLNYQILELLIIVTLVVDIEISKQLIRLHFFAMLLYTCKNLPTTGLLNEVLQVPGNSHV